MEVVAFVGPAGSGKSHRASMVALQYGCDTIIDDGLVVRDGKILAGRSAKREETKMAAVKRAIFHAPDHREEVKAVIWQFKPSRILILGTSLEMIERITDALDLPRPDQVVHIDEVASPAQIRLARRKRRQEGKHVIPAPTMEVKKTFSGYMVDPLRYLLRRQDQEEPVPVEKSVVRPTYSALGRFYVADTVLAAIATHEAERVPGMAHVTRVVTESGNEGVTVQIDATLRYGHGQELWSVLRSVQEKVKDAIEQMTALNVLSVDVHARRLSLE